MMIFFDSDLILNLFVNQRIWVLASRTFMNLSTIIIKYNGEVPTKDNQVLHISLK